MSVQRPKYIDTPVHDWPFPFGPPEAERLRRYALDLERQLAEMDKDWRDAMAALNKSEVELVEKCTENERLREALSRLVGLKDYRDKHGKDEWYLQEQPVAWENARDALAAQPETPTTDQTIEQAKAHTMTPEERETQRRSFAYGNAAIDNPNVTRKMIDDAADSETPTKRCNRCKGKGFEVVQDGCWSDEIWCDTCKGTGRVPADTEAQPAAQRPISDALAASLRARRSEAHQGGREA